MNSPRLEIDLDKISHNARTLVERLAPAGITVTGVTKAALAAPAIAGAMVLGGVSSLGDSRVENLLTLRAASGGFGSESRPTLTLIRSPMLSQVDEVVALADTSFNTEAVVIGALSAAAVRLGIVHDVVLMVELGDLREGVLPHDVMDLARVAHDAPGIRLVGLGANLACQSGVSPDRDNMAELSRLVELVESKLAISIDVVSGGNSANLDWALASVVSGTDTGRINNLRLGESILLGCEPLHRRPIDGLFTDAFILVAEVIESKVKPTEPWGTLAQPAFVENATAHASTASPTASGLSKRAVSRRALLALGRQDVDPAGLAVAHGMRILGASSDHLVLEIDDGIDDDAVGRVGGRVGDEVAFQVDYSALVRAMTSPFVAKEFSSSATTPRSSRPQ